MEIKLDLPGDLFDSQYPEPRFAERVRELAILELIRAKRLHEHEAQRMLGLERWELVERMRQAGIAPTEQIFGEIRDQMDQAIANAARKRRGPAS